MSFTPSNTGAAAAPALARPEVSAAAAARAELSARSLAALEPGVRPFWFDGRPRIGIHTSTAGEASRALDTAARIGCTALQIFSGSPRMWPRAHQRAVGPAVARRFRERREALRLGPLAIHANYLINLASSDPRLWQRSVNAFRDELARGAQLSAEYLIVHPGSVRGGDVARAIENVAEGIARAVRGLAAGPATAPGSRPPRVLIENTAGQGTALGSCLEELCRLLYACGARGVTPRPGVCLDTAHLLAAGYEIRTPEGLEKTLAAVDSVIGLENVFAIHVNDSKAPIGSRVDRHEHIGRGHIGRQAFAHILNHPRLRSATRVFLLETPIDRPGDDRRNVRTLWKLLGREAPVVKIRSAVRPARSKRVAHKLQARRRHAARKVSRRASRRSPRREN